MQRKEIFKPVVGYEDYEVSNLGRIVSLKCGKRKVMKPTVNDRGYKRVQLSLNGVVKRHSIHRLVYEAFKGPIPDGLVIDHINWNKLDNRLDNLQAVTQRQNASKDKWRYDRTCQSIGVYFDRGRYRAEITLPKSMGCRDHYIGSFYTEQEAAAAYQDILKGGFIDLYKYRAILKSYIAL